MIGVRFDTTSHRPRSRRQGWREVKVASAALGTGADRRELGIALGPERVTTHPSWKCISSTLSHSGHLRGHLATAHHAGEIAL